MHRGWGHDDETEKPTTNHQLPRSNIRHSPLAFPVPHSTFAILHARAPVSRPHRSPPTLLPRTCAHLANTSCERKRPMREKKVYRTEPRNRTGAIENAVSPKKQTQTNPFFASVKGPRRGSYRTTTEFQDSDQTLPYVCHSRSQPTAKQEPGFEFVTTCRFPGILRRVFRNAAGQAQRCPERSTRARSARSCYVLCRL